MLKAVLFDLDQTLINWDNVEPWESYQLGRMSAVYNLVDKNMHPLASLVPEDLCAVFMERMESDWKRGAQTFQPPNVIKGMAATLQACGVPADRLDLEAVMRLYFDWPLPQGECAYPDARAVLTELREHGVELGIVTNASHPMIYRDRELAEVGLLDLFPKCRVSAVDVGFLKPHRAIYDYALGMLGVHPEEAVFIGDNLDVDVEGAQGVGIRGIWVDRMQDNPQTKSEVIPDGTITTLAELLPLLDRHYPGWRNGHSL